jgi:hypothetical protein
MAYRGVLVVALVASLAGQAWAQVGAGGEFQVNTYTTGSQWFPLIAVERDADFTIAWLGQDGSLYGVIGQRFDASGARRGGEFQVNTYTTGAQGTLGGPDVSVDRTGGFVVVWPSAGQDGSGNGAFGQRHDSTGARAGSEFQVNTYTTGNQGTGYAGSLGVARAPDGSFVVVWDSEGQDGLDLGIFMRRYDAAGNPLGGEVAVNTYTTAAQLRPDVAMDGGGNFVVVWGSSSQDGSGYGVFGQRFDASGNRQGGEFQVNSYTTGHQSYSRYFGPTVGRARGGAFVVMWDDSARDGSNFGVFAQRFDAQGNPDGADFQVNTYTTSLQALAAASMDDLGNFVVAWTDVNDGSVFSVNGRRFTAAGVPRGASFMVNTYTPGQQFFPEIGSDDVGNFVVTWTSLGQDGSFYGVFGQRFGGLRPNALDVDATGSRVWEPGETAEVRPTWRNINGAAQAFGGTLTGLTGPAGATYSIADGLANYGTVSNGASSPCTDCYQVSVNNPPARPVPHWDASAVESITPDTQGQQKRWALHIGGSFTDVPTSSSFYPFVETLFHFSVTGGCGGGNYCPADSTSREQLSVFVLIAKEGAGFAPPACTSPTFNDVPINSPFCPFIEELARRGVVSGCGGGNFCPAAPVTREQIPVFVLRTLDPALNPPACTTPVFNDVPASSPFCRWIEELARRGVVSGCGGGNYCPADAVTREQMGVFVSATFGLALYGP